MPSRAMSLRRGIGSAGATWFDFAAELTRPCFAVYIDTMNAMTLFSALFLTLSSFLLARLLLRRAR